MSRKKEAERISATKIRKQQVHAKNNGICAHCGKPIKIGEDFSIDHIIPLSKGGTNDFKNLIPLCRECNKEKDNDVLDESYYAYTPKVITEEIAQLMNEYYEDKDWLTEDNVFRNDRFSVKVLRTIPLRNGKLIQKPAVCEFRKMKEDEYEKLMEVYIEDFEDIDEIESGIPQPEDKSEMVHVSLGTPYQAVFGGRTVCTVCCSLTAGTGGGTGLDGRGVLRLFLTINPEITFGPSSKFIIDSILDAVIDKVAESVNWKGTKGLVLCCIDAHVSDKRAVEMITLRSEMRKSPLSYLRDADDFTPVFIRSTSVLSFGGIDVPKDGISLEEFTKTEKLYSGQLRRRMSKNSKN